jgi:protein-S-isoprenylcysteine O-methyltransferase Ste14
MVMTTGRARKSALIGLGVVAILVGLLWIGQGLGVIPGSFMTGDSKWFVIGAIVTLVGVLLVFTGFSRSSQAAKRP